MTDETTTHTRTAWHPVLLLALMAFFLALTAMNADRRAFQARPDVRTRWQGQDVRVSADREGAFVVTHLHGTRLLADGSRDDVTAMLPDPVSLIDEVAGATIGAATLATLDWRGADGRTAGPPVPGSPLRAVVSPVFPATAADPNACSTTPGPDGANPLAIVPG